MSRHTGNVYRMTISITQDLKERMDGAGQEVNWSAVAARAFEQKLGEIAAQKREKSVEDVIQRLRLSKLRQGDADYQRGYAVGTRWSSEVAEVSELEQLATLRGEAEDRDGFVHLIAGDDAYGIHERFYFRLHPLSPWDKMDAEAFWEQAVGDEPHLVENAAFLRGFSDGALGVWDQVKDRI